jgi:HTH-type transcriptional regulator / antitoxin HipB
MATTPIRTPADIGALIRDRRRALGLGQAELAAKVGASRLWVNQIERGKPGASLGLVLRTLATLGLTLHGADAQQPAELSRSKRPAPVTSVDINAVIARARSKSQP